MTQSQTIAKIFTIIGYVLLIPGILGTALSLMTFYFAIIPIVIFSLGILLLIGYRKHSRGNLSENNIMPLWFGTILYNSVLLIPQIWLILNSYSIFQIDNAINEGGIGVSVYFALISWQFIAILLAIIAIRDEIFS